MNNYDNNFTSPYNLLLFTKTQGECCHHAHNI